MLAHKAHFSKQNNFFFSFLVHAMQFLLFTINTILLRLCGGIYILSEYTSGCLLTDLGELTACIAMLKSIFLCL